MTRNLISEIQRDLGVSKVTIRVIEELARRAGYSVELLQYSGAKGNGSPIYGVRRLGSTRRSFRATGSAREVAEYLSAEVER